MGRSKNLVLADAINTAIKVSKENIKLKRALIISVCANAVLLGGLICVLSF
jgi:hypothetical protein